MKILKSPHTLHRWRKKPIGRSSIGFVPTMGALHEGHLYLVKKSLRENTRTIVSIFVNPIQFRPEEDLENYPRPIKKDLALLKHVGVDVVYTPTAKMIYPPSFQTKIMVSSLTQNLCGSPRSRGPEHFHGVATVVAILFNQVRPTKAYFGLKDYQQVRVIEQMQNDLNFGIKIVRCPIVREPDGLAMSSRNAYLSSSDRHHAPKLYLALQYGRKLLLSDNKMTPHIALNRVRKRLSSIPNSQIDYVELVDPKTLEHVQARRRPALLAAAVKIRNTRLIDNLLI